MRNTPLGVFGGVELLLLLLKPGNWTSREVFSPLQYQRGIITSTHIL